jgi:transcription initiation factor TFIIB
MDDLYSSLDELTVNSEPVQTCCDKSDNHLLGDGMILCKACNNIITNIVDSAEWRFYGANDSKSSDPTRCGMPINNLLPESSVGSFVSNRGSRNFSMNKVRKYQQWGGMPYKERTLLKVFQDISRVCKAVGIPEIIIKEAHVLYKVVSSTKITRGANRKGIIAACVYFSCKINNVARSTNEIAVVFSLSPTIMTKGCKKFQEIMQINKVDIERIHNTNTITIDDFIDRFCSKLDLSDEDIVNVKHISYLSQVYNLINDNTPPAMAAGCIYLYIKEEEYVFHKREISDVCKVSEVTINKCYKKLENHKDKLLV